jgi:hypothetical protein
MNTWRLPVFPHPGAFLRVLESWAILRLGDRPVAENPGLGDNGHVTNANAKKQHAKGH